MDQRLRVTEIFYSIQGETSRTGLPSVFIRLTGCPLRCTYCDTAYAFQGGALYSLDEILSRVKGYKTTWVTVTGGEPLAQPLCIALLRRLCDEGYAVSLETSGALSMAEVDARVMKVMDLKTPSSGECERNRWKNLDYLLPQDEVKFVIGDRMDYEWAKEVLSGRGLAQRQGVLFSPSEGILSPTVLAEWILQDQLAVRFQVQLHKYLWGDVRGR